MPKGDPAGYLPRVKRSRAKRLGAPVYKTPVSKKMKAPKSKPNLKIGFSESMLNASRAVARDKMMAARGKPRMEKPSSSKRLLKGYLSRKKRGM